MREIVIDGNVFIVKELTRKWSVQLLKDDSRIKILIDFPKKDYETFESVKEYLLAVNEQKKQKS